MMWLSKRELLNPTRRTGGLSFSNHSHMFVNAVLMGIVSSFSGSSPGYVSLTRSPSSSRARW